MAVSLQSIQYGVSVSPPRILIYGVQGIGKSTMLNHAPYPIVIQTEDGEGVLDTPRFPLARSFDEVMDAIGVLANTEHQFKTLGVDSLDWLEPLIWQKVVEDNPTTSKRGGAATGIESYGYGKGFAMALDYWREYLDGLNYLRTVKGMMIIQTAHSKITRFESPDNEPYDRYELKLQHSPKTSASALLQEHSDVVLFANYKVHVAERKDGNNPNAKVRRQALGGDQRFLYTQERPAYTAKNRYNLPEALLFDREGNYWNVLANHIPYLQVMGLEAQEAPAAEVQEQEQHEVQQQAQGV